MTVWVLTCGRAAESLGDVCHVNEHCLDAVALALDFGQDAGHLVAVEGIADGAVHVHGAHGDAADGGDSGAEEGTLAHDGGGDTDGDGGGGGSGAMPLC